jgi:hypothetical protein
MRAVLFHVVALGALTLGWPITALAQEAITVCGASTGKGFYLEPKKNLEELGKLGWIDDNLPNGSITFLRYPSGDYDIVIKSAITTITARGDGGKVVKVHGMDDKVATFVVVYQLATTEVYQLTLNAFGHGTLIWAVLKNRGGSLGITRGSLYTATCDLR